MKTFEEFDLFGEVSEYIIESYKSVEEFKKDLEKNGVRFENPEEMIEVTKILVVMGYDVYNMDNVMKGDIYNRGARENWKGFYFGGKRFSRHSGYLSKDVLSLEDLKNLKIREKIRRPDIDPFDEEDWGYVQ